MRRVNFTGSTRVGRLVADEVRRAPQALPARAGRQGAAGRARRRRPRGGRRRRELRRVHELRARSACRPSGSWPTARSPDELGAKLAERAGKLTVGDPRDQAHDDRPGRQRRARASAIIELIEDARAKGAEVLTGGEADGNLITPDRARRRHARDAHLRRGVVRPGRRDRAGGRRRRGGARRQRHRVRPLRRRVRRGRRPRRWRSPAGSRAASATSTPRPSTTSRRCRSAASRPAAGAASAARRRSRSSPSCAG